MFAEFPETQNTQYDVLDGCFGTVVGRNRKGAYLKLDNGEDAYAHKFGNLLPGSKVLCTVLKLAKEDRLKLVSIDSVVQYAIVA